MSQKSTFYRIARAIWRKVKLIRLRGQLARDHLYDLRRFGAWSHGTDTDKTQAQGLHAIYKSYHGIEKGLSLRAPRVGFGVDKIAALMRKLREYRARFDPDGVPAAVSALHRYQAFNADHATQNRVLETFLTDTPDDHSGGITPVTRDDILAATTHTGPDFFWSRHSVRQYADRPVPLDMVTAAVDMARKTPSVCNRQGARVHVFEDAQKALDWQPGNAGFGHLASRALIVTADLQAFSGTGERNQPFIDGGMFAMSLLYTLHAQGLGACPLAWSMPAPRDRAMRRALNIPDSEVVIMMISVGHLPDTFAVATSHRMPLDHFMVRH